MLKNLIYTGGRLDRAAALRTDTGWLERTLAEGPVKAVPVWRTRSLVVLEREPAAVFVDGDAARALIALGRQWIFLGLEEEIPVVAVDLSDQEEEVAHAQVRAHVPEDARFEDIRGFGGQLSVHDATTLAYARGILNWNERQNFCTDCGTATRPIQGGHVHKCTNPDCGKSHFPRTDPAVIMLVTHTFEDGVERCLLGWSQRWEVPMYSTLAGFVEPGESLEEAVAREVYEEAGVRVDDVVYKGSQPWPFPASIMLGFTARATQPEITVDPEEIREAHWFSRDELATFGEMKDENVDKRLPRKDSIARGLIEDWRAQG